jgi:HSP20 family protein
MLTRWNEFGMRNLDRDLDGFGDLRREMDRVVSDFERYWGLGGNHRPNGRGAARGEFPRLSIEDRGAELRLRAEVPGLGEEDIDVSLEQTTLTIRGQRKPDVPEGYSVHRQERGPLAFARSFTLPCRVDAEKVVATLENGVLEMTLPKVPEEQPRRIQVRAP